MSTHTHRIGFAALLLAALAMPAHGQQAEGSSRWLAFVGCWEPMGAEGEAGLLCFRPTSDGVEMSNHYEGEVTATEYLTADGVARAVTAEGCTGTESVEFSEDGRRVFTASSFQCEGGESRTGSGVMSFISPSQWVDVRSLTVDGEAVAWAQRYTAATAESLTDHAVEDPMSLDRANIRARRLLVARDIDMEDVEEAIGKVDSEGIKAWLATHETELEVDAETLVRLSDAGVPDDVLDVMVAVSFPERFAVTPEGVPTSVRERVATNAYREGRPVRYRSFLYDPFYSPFGYRYGYAPYGYSRFGYYGYGYGGYYGYVPASVVVIDRAQTYPAGGQIVRGSGYRAPRASSGSGGGSGGGSIARSPDGGGSGSSGSTSGSSSSGRRAVRR